MATPTKIKTPMPAWLRRHLADAGVMVNGATRTARPSTCPRCRARVIRGLTEEPLAVLAVCDPNPLSNLGEAMALMEGRLTFDLARRGSRIEIDLREIDHIRGSPPETPDSWRAKGDVLAAHRCTDGIQSDPLPGIESRIP